MDKYLSENFVDHSAMQGIPSTRDGVKMLFSAFYAAFPDLRATIHDQVAEGDKVVTRKTLSGTHRGELVGIPPTGKQVTFDVIDVLRVSNVKIAEHWAAMDQFGLMKQLGVFPAQS